MHIMLVKAGEYVYNLYYNNNETFYFNHCLSPHWQKESSGIAENKQSSLNT